MTAEAPISSPASSRWPGYLIALALTALGVAVLLRIAPPERSTTQLAAFGAVGAGIAWLIGTHWIHRGAVAAAMRWLSVNALVLAAMLGAVELLGRLAHIDMRMLQGQKEDPRLAFPPWSREPDRELDEVFFQHPGPMEWTGQPLRKVHELKLGTSNVYDAEPSFTVRYDAEGFRNPSDLKDWDLAIVGDSYTELGYLPDKQLISSVVARGLGQRVKNLGTCDIGLFTEARYVRRFAAAPSCKRVVLVFFEGNDVQDSTDEYRALQLYQKTGERPHRALQPQYSFVTAAIETTRALLNKPKPQSYQNAWFIHAGKELPVTMSNQLPLDPKTMSADERTALLQGLQSFAAEARALHLQPLLVYVPFNNRVYHGKLRFTDSLPAEVRDWQPNSLPAHVQTLCAEHGIDFLDTTPQLRAAAEAGTFVHNPILDCHVNAEGARLIAEAIVQRLKAAP